MKAELTQDKPRSLKDLINSDAIKSQIARALPKHLTPDRFLRVATTTLLRVPKLAECDQASFMKAMLDCSAVGLEPDGRRAHLIPFNNRKAGIVECQLIIDYKGLIELAKRSGEVAVWNAYTVCENDRFSWRNGTVNHEIDWLSDRGKVRAFYSHVLTKEGQDDYEVMTLADVERIRGRSRSANDGPWVTDFEEMGKKTVMRRHSKRLTLSPEFMDALERDGDRIEEEREVVARVIDKPERKPVFEAPEIKTAEAPAETVTTEGESFTLEAEEPFPDGAAPDVQLEWLMLHHAMPEAELIEILHRLKSIKPEETSLADLTDKKVAGIVKHWDLVMGERKGGGE